MTKTVLFVTYGGGHARMITPVVHALADNPDIKVVSVALTLGASVFASEGLPYKGFKDFLLPSDAVALAWGKKLAKEFHNPDSGIAEEESIAYLGLSYWDLITRYGKAKAAEMWSAKGRHAFLPLTIMQRILDQVKPDIVVTTNSPKAEQAAVEAANERGILTLSLVDLFGIHHFHPLEAKYITVLCDRVIDNMWNEGVTRPRDAFIIAGNPAFDRAFDHRGPIDEAFRAEHFPSIPKFAKILLWIDMPAYWNLAKRELHLRSDAEILRDLNTLADATKENGGYLFVRPHPSQSHEVYNQWFKEKAHGHVFFTPTLPLYPLLKAIDVVVTYTSTVSVEALFMQRRVIQLKYQPGKSDMPLGEWGLAWQAESPDELPKLIGEAFHDDVTAEKMQTRVKLLLAQEKAGPKIAECVKQLVGSRAINQSGH